MRKESTTRLTSAKCQMMRNQTSTKINKGSPTPVISGMVHFKSKACRIIVLLLVFNLGCRRARILTFDKTILKIFCTLIACEVEQKMRGAFIALANRLA